jgi:hypothetical protein
VKEKGSNKNLNEPAMGAIATKPQTVKNTYGRGGGTFTPGTAPAGGYQAVWNFGDDRSDTKNSPISKPGLKVY